MRPRLEDQSGAVQVAAAEALARIGKTDAALPILERWVQNTNASSFALQAANVLDRLGEQARSALPVLKQSLNSAAKNRANASQYPERILERIIAVLERKTPALVYPAVSTNSQGSGHR